MGFVSWRRDLCNYTYAYISPTLSQQGLKQTRNCKCFQLLLPALCSYKLFYGIRFHSTPIILWCTYLKTKNQIQTGIIPCSKCHNGPGILVKGVQCTDTLSPPERMVLNKGLPFFTQNSLKGYLKMGFLNQTTPLMFCSL